MPHFDPCPFCGAEILVRLFNEVSDMGDKCSEGLYALVHEETKKLCPIVHYDGEYLGIMLYESPSDAAAIWNTRCGLQASIKEE